MLLVMKLTIVLLIVGVLQVSAKGFSQTVTLSERNATLETVFRKIEKQTGFFFWYENKMLRDTKKVNIAMQGVSLEQALRQCFADQPLTYEIVDKTIVVREKKPVAGSKAEKMAEAPPAFEEITGVVVDESGKPLSGASVTIKGSSHGTSTDAEGHFTLQAPGNNGVLVISYVGMNTQEIHLNGRKDLRVVLAKTVSEQVEVVIIGYGSQKKREVTGSVASVKVGEISQDVSGNVSSALQGRVAGVAVESNSGAPGAGLSITIRGSSTLGSNSPLYVVDGVFLGNIDFINPSDIESIDILKDASAASIYGSRAANGVILITTKSGKKNSGPKVQVSAVHGYQAIPKRISVLDGKQWTDLFKANVSGIPDYNGVSTNWQDVVFHSAPMSKLNMNVSGGSANFIYNVSGGYLKQDGTIRNTGYSAANFRVKTQFEKGRVKIGETVMISYNNGRQLPTGGDQPGIKNGLLVMLPTVPVYDTANKLGGWGRRASYMKNLSNPLANLTAKDFENNATTVLAEAFMEVRLIDQLKYKLNVGITNSRSYGNQYISAYDDGNNAVSQAQLNQSSGFTNSWLLENTLNYDKKIGVHNISLLAGYTAQKDSVNGFNAAGTGIPAFVYTLNGATANQTVGGSASSTRRISLLGRATYSYDARYMVSASIRRDGSSIFAAGHQYGVYPAVSAGWNVSNENFFRNSVNPAIISSLKLRGGWGKLGNDLIGNYTTLSTITSNINYIQGNNLWQGAIPNGNASPKDLKWEQTKSVDGGIDASFLNNKLSLTFDVFKKTTSGVLLGVPVPISLGITGSPVVNAGVVENKGIELGLNYSDRAGDLSYDLGFNLTTLNNKMTAITIGSGKQEFGDITRAKVGYPLGGFWLIKTNGIFQSDAEAAAYTDKNGNRIQPNAMGGDIRFVDFDGNGRINNDDKQYMGSPVPNLMLGLSGYFTWKDFDLNLLFQGTFGNKMYNSSRIWLEKMTEVTNLSSAALNAWTPSNHSNFPRFVLADPNQNAQVYTDRWLEDGSYLRFKRMELGYTLLKSLSRKMNIERIRVNVSAENLFTITKYKGFNPDIGNGGDPLSRGIDEGRFITGSLYPLQRTILFGLNVSF